MIVKLVDVTVQSIAQFTLISKQSSSNQFGFHRMKEGFHMCVVSTASGSIHTGLDPKLVERLPKSQCGIFNPSIGMKNHTLLRTTPFQGIA
jgi:hypothetical protein